jgi:hypothetical protein
MLIDCCAMQDGIDSKILHATLTPVSCNNPQKINIAQLRQLDALSKQEGEHEAAHRAFNSIFGLCAAGIWSYIFPNQYSLCAVGLVLFYACIKKYKASQELDLISSKKRVLLKQIIGQNSHMSDAERMYLIMHLGKELA